MNSGICILVSSNTMTTITRHFIFILIYFLGLFSAKGQTLCAPFYAIGLTNKDKVWQVIFEGCMDVQSPIIIDDENPLLRAQVVSRLGIKKIISSESKNAEIKTEYFDKSGYTIFVGNRNDTINGLYYFNVFNAHNLLTSVVYKDGYSINGIKNKNSDTLHTVEKYIYDDQNRIIEQQTIITSLIKDFICVNGKGTKVTYYKKPHSSKFSQTINYDNKNNITALNTNEGNRDVFTYDSKNKIISASDLTKNLINAETWSFIYNDKNLIDSIIITHKDKSFESYIIKLHYNNEDRLINFLKYHSDGRVWSDIKFDYFNGLLIEINDCSNSNKVCFTKKIYYNNDKLINKIEYIHNNTMIHWTEYSYEFFNAN